MFVVRSKFEKNNLLVCIKIISGKKNPFVERIKYFSAKHDLDGRLLKAYLVRYIIWFLFETERFKLTSHACSVLQIYCIV